MTSREWASSRIMRLWDDIMEEVIETGLTGEQEDFLIEEGMEKIREERTSFYIDIKE